MVDMISLSQNIDDMPEYEPLPSGPYPAEVRHVEVAHSEKIPTGYIKMALMVDPSDYPADYDASNAPEGVPLTYARVRIPTEDRRTVRPFKMLLAALGVSGGSSFDPGEWVGKQVQVLVSRSEYQGALVNNVETVTELPSV